MQAVRVDELVARRVSELRRERGWSQTDLADRLDEVGSWTALEQPTIAKIEKGHRRVAVQELCSLAMAFGVSPSAFFSAPEDEEVEVTPGLVVPGQYLKPWAEGRIALRREDAPNYPSQETFGLTTAELAQRIDALLSNRRAVSDTEREILLAHVDRSITAFRTGTPAIVFAFRERRPEVITEHEQAIAALEEQRDALERLPKARRRK